ncbi:hypothetical protein BGC07_03480 [Piscirickettsia litoralis]|uniref:SSD domain-containing protein n=2 Tax=Piscirickettsia litoralis TaxID=1891921 RepID=A0ABX2ZZZ0_9GAMM|nr:hypothetical protein BGC07_03480 [Piscirickettsia litoralis]
MVFVSALGVSINLITLLAMVIAVGLVVDDAIVVIENITRYIEQGYTKHQAILSGTQDISITVIGITLTLLAVYVPIVFSAGDFSALLKPFALTLAAAVFISGIVALTLTPTMAALFVSSKDQNSYQVWFNKVLHKIISFYQNILGVVLYYYKVALFIVVVMIALGVFYTLKLPRTVFPADPNGAVEIVMTGNSKDGIESLKHKVLVFKKFYKNKTTDYYMINIAKDEDSGILTAKVNIHYKDKYLKENYKFSNQINQFIKAQNIDSAFATMKKFSNWGGGYGISFYLYGGGSNVTQVNQAAKKITALMDASPIFSITNNTINKPQKQLAFQLNTVKAISLGILRQDIIQMLSSYYGGGTLDNYFSIAGLSVPIIVQVSDSSLKDPKSIESLQIQSPLTHKYYPLTEFVSVKLVAKPLMVSTFNNQPSVKINANISKGYTLKQAIEFVNQVTSKNTPDIQLQYVDKADQYLRGSNETIWIALLGILSVYLLLTVLFRNLIDPFIIMLTVPFTVIGGALSLYLIGGTLNIYSVLGLITLVGLITKHGVLIVQFANVELARGKHVREAILLATHHRFRPIIMTTLAMVFGALPLLVSDGMMYVSRRKPGDYNYRWFGCGDFVFIIYCATGLYAC